MKFRQGVTDSRAALRAGVLLCLLALGACNWSANTDTPHFALGGTVAGLTENGLVLANNGATLTVNSGTTNFSFGAVLQKGDPYAVSVQTAPAGLFCSVAGGKGTMGTADVNNVVVTCSTQAFTLGGTITGLNGSGLVLTDGIDTVAVPVNATSFTLPTPVAYTSGYVVSVTLQPTGVTCAVTNGTGTIPAANVTNVLVTCSDQPYSLGGTISGLTTDGLVLANGTDRVRVLAPYTSFVMPLQVAYTSPYAVTVVLPQPAGLTCSVSKGSGFMPAAAVTTVLVTCSANAYTLGGTITGLNGSGLVLANNGSDGVAVPANATSFTMPTKVAYTSPYAVTVVLPQPAGLTCSVGNGTGTMPAASVTSVSVTCSDLTYTLGGTITGLNASGLVLANGTDELTVVANATMFTMPTAVAYTSPYTVTVKAQHQPLGELCDVTGGDSGTGSGIMPAAPVNSVQVLCTPQPFSVGGTVTGLAPGASIVLLDNGIDPLTRLVNGTFTFAAKVLSGSNYAVTVGTQPTSPPQTCSVTGGASGTGSGTVQGVNVTNVTVTCATDSFTIGGNVSGLTGSGLVLHNGTEDLPAPVSGSFTFTTKIASGNPYLVTVKTQPTNPAQTCAVQNGSGTVTTTNVTNVILTCTTDTFTIGGAVSGLTGSGLVLQNNGGDDEPVPADGPFTFKTKVANGSPYVIAVKKQPKKPAQTCTVQNDTGTVAGANVTNVTVSCTLDPTFTIGGDVSGLGSGVSVVIRNNGADDLTVSTDGLFAFATKIASGSTYLVTIPAPLLSNGQICTVANDAGTVVGAPVTDVAVSCNPKYYTIGGTLSGLGSGVNVVLRNNGADDLTLSADGPFTFATKIASGGTYLVTIPTPLLSNGQMCTVTSDAGTVVGAPVTDVAVSCTP